MSLRMSAEEFVEFERKRLAAKPARTKAPVSTKPGPLSATARMQTKGRLAPGQMNKSETAYAAVLDQRKQAGEILWWAFEGVKLKIAPNTHLTIDFTILLASGELQMHDVKGAKAIIQDDAKVKMKVARSMFPFPMFYAFPPKRKGEAWTLEEV